MASIKIPWYKFWDKGSAGSAVNNYLVGQSSPEWLNDKQLLDWYSLVPQVKTVINRKALMASNMKIRLVRGEGEDAEQIDTHPVLNLLQTPNVLQSQKEFIIQNWVFFEIFGESFTLMNGGEFITTPSSLFNLPNDLLEMKLTGKLYKQIEESGIIDGYKLEVNGKSEDYKAEEIIHFANYGGSDGIKGQSVLKTLQFPVTNTFKSYEARNVLIAKRGAIGILSNSSGDETGSIPLKPKEKEELQEKFDSKYGLKEDQSQVIVTNGSLKWQAMNFDVEELALHLEETQNFRILVDAFGLNMNIFSDEKGATFENQKEGQRSAYESTIIPQAESWLEKLSKAILTEQDIKSGLRLWPDFTHLPCLQANQKEKAEADDKKASAFKKTVEGIEKLRALNLIDESQARDLLDL